MDQNAITFRHQTGKAGLTGFDVQNVNKIIEDLSSKSQFGLKQQRTRAELAQKVENMKNNLAEHYSRGEQYIQQVTQQVDEILEKIEQERNMQETWIYIDMDSFYASVEMRDNPALMNIPMGVGGNSMLSTANYEARKFGISSGMPGYIALKLCPQLTIIPCNFDKYKEAAAIVRQIFAEYDPEFESMGLDEASLLVTQYLKDNNKNNKQGRIELAQEIRDRIFQATQLTASAGIACNRRLAKIATDFNKPNGQYYLEFDKDVILEFMNNLRIRKLPGVGQQSEMILKSLGIQQVGDILPHKVDIFLEFSEINFMHLMRSALGIGQYIHSETQNQKSISISRNFQPTEDLQFLIQKLREYAESIEQELEKNNMEAKTITVSLKDFEFESVSKGVTVPIPIHTKEDLFETSVNILRGFKISKPIRLIGLRASQLQIQNNNILRIDALITSNAQTPSKPGISLVRRQCPHCKLVLNRPESGHEVHARECQQSGRKNARKTILDFFSKG